MGLADTMSALNTGAIDSAELGFPFLDNLVGMHEHAKHYYFPGWHQQSTLFDLMMNKDKYDALSDVQKARNEAVCRDYIHASLAEGEAIQGVALAELKEKGVNIHRWSPEILAELNAAWNDVAAELAASNPNFKKVWESLTKFREQYKVWGDLGYL